VCNDVGGKYYDSQSISHTQRYLYRILVDLFLFHRAIIVFLCLTALTTHALPQGKAQTPFQANKPQRPLVVIIALQHSTSIVLFHPFARSPSGLCDGTNRAPPSDANTCRFQHRRRHTQVKGKAESTNVEAKSRRTTTAQELG